MVLPRCIFHAYFPRKYSVESEFRLVILRKKEKKIHSEVENYEFLQLK